MTLSSSGVIESVNIGFCEIIGCDRKFVVGQKIEKFFSVAGRVFYQTHVWPLMQMASEVNEIHLLLRDAKGVSIAVLFNARCIEEEGVLKCHCVFFPIDRRLKYEDEIISAKNNLAEANAETVRINNELLALQQQLEDRVEQRTSELLRAYEEMESFNYSIAHDFRAPLRAISSSARILIEELEGRLDEEQLQLLMRQSINSEKLGRVIDDLLGLSRLSRIALEMTEVDLSRVAEELSAALEREEGFTGCTFTVQPEMIALASENLVWVLLNNLIGNACKFSPEGGEVSVTSSEVDGRKVYAVRDHGVGFDMTYAKKIFLPFERLVLEGEFAGNGIGLASAHRAVLRMNGNLWAESEPGRGSVFYFTLGQS